MPTDATRRTATTTMTRRATGRSGLAVVAVALLLAGCGGQASGLDLQTPAPEVSRSAAPVAEPATPMPSLAASTTPPATTASAQTPQQQVIAGYEAYYDLFRSLNEMPAAQRPAALASVAVDPLYSAVLKELDSRDAAGKVTYGRTETHPEVALLQGDSAAIRDCQNTSTSGLMNKATGEKLTVGVPAYLRLSEMKRGSDGIWRITTINAYPNAKC